MTIEFRRSIETLEARFALAGNLFDGPALDLVYDSINGALSVRADSPVELTAIEVVLADSNLFTQRPDIPEPFSLFLSNTFQVITWASLQPVTIEGEVELGASLPSGIETAADLSLVFEEVHYHVASEPETTEFDLSVVLPNPPKLNLTFDGEPAPEIVSLKTVTFEDPAPTRNAVIENLGDDPLTITAIASEPFSVTPTSAIIERGNTQTFSIAMDTSSTGKQSGILSFVHNDPNLVANPLELPLEGTVSQVLHLSFDGYGIGASQIDQWSLDWELPADALDPNGRGLNVAPFYEDLPERDELISKTIDFVNFALNPFGLRAKELQNRAPITVGEGATTVFIGNVAEFAEAEPHRAGDIDVGNDNDTDIAFVGEEDWGSIDRTALATANIILHEAGHTFGLSHISVDGEVTDEVMQSIRDTPDNLAPRNFTDVTFSTSGGSQNSGEEMLRLFDSSTSFPTEFPEYNPFVSGDVNLDGVVKFDDFLALSTNFGGEGSRTDGDMNGDGLIDFSDFLILSTNFGYMPVIYSLESEFDTAG